MKKYRNGVKEKFIQKYEMNIYFTEKIYIIIKNNKFTVNYLSKFKTVRYIYCKTTECI